MLRTRAERRADGTVATREARQAQAVHAQTAKEEPQRTSALAPSPKDQINAIIRNAEPMEAAAPAESGNRIVLVQKALNKIGGYGQLKEDGAFGNGTRLALEKFEADRRLPVRGEPQGKTLRELSHLSSIAIE